MTSQEIMADIFIKLGLKVEQYVESDVRGNRIVLSLLIDPEGIKRTQATCTKDLWDEETHSVNVYQCGEIMTVGGCGRQCGLGEKYRRGITFKKRFPDNPDCAKGLLDPRLQTLLES